MHNHFSYVIINKNLFICNKKLKYLGKSAIFRCNLVGRWIPKLFFGDDKNIFRIKANRKARQCKLTTTGYTKDYVFKSKFFLQKDSEE